MSASEGFYFTGSWHDWQTLNKVTPSPPSASAQTASNSLDPGDNPSTSSDTPVDRLCSGMAWEDPHDRAEMAEPTSSFRRSRPRPLALKANASLIQSVNSQLSLPTESDGSGESRRHQTHVQWPKRGAFCKYGSMPGSDEEAAAFTDSMCSIRHDCTRQKQEQLNEIIRQSKQSLQRFVGRTKVDWERWREDPGMRNLRSVVNAVFSRLPSDYKSKKAQFDQLKFGFAVKSGPALKPAQRYCAPAIPGTRLTALICLQARLLSDDKLIRETKRDWNDILPESVWARIPAPDAVTGLLDPETLANSQDAQPSDEGAHPQAELPAVI